MTTETIKQIESHPDFIFLVKERKKFTYGLSGLMLSIYFGFILTIAFNPSVLATPLSAGSTTSYGIVIGVSILFIAFILTGFYTFVANTLFDPEIEKIKKELAL
jgi:uncharacterized membrane protein (DUF485 family)